MTGFLLLGGCGGRLFFQLACALVARIKFFLEVKRLALRAGQRQGGVFRLPPPYLWTPLSPQRVKGCSPLTNPRRKSKHKNASRFAKTGCGAQRPLRALSGTRVLLTAAPTAPPCIRRRRRSSLLRIFLCFSYLRLRRRFHLSAELHALQGRNASCEAASRRNEKKVQQRRPLPAADTGRSCWGRGQQDTSAAQGTKWTLGTATRLSEAASIFGLRLLLWNC